MTQRSRERSAVSKADAELFADIRTLYEERDRELREQAERVGGMLTDTAHVFADLDVQSSKPRAHGLTEHLGTFAGALVDCLARTTVLEQRKVTPHQAAVRKEALDNATQALNAAFQPAKAPMPALSQSSLVRSFIKPLGQKPGFYM